MTTEHRIRQRIIASSCAAMALLGSMAGPSTGAVYAMGASQSSTASGNGSPTSPAVCPTTVTVTGIASHSVAATVAQMTLNMNIVAGSADELFRDEQHVEQKVTVTLKRIGIPATDVTVITSALNAGIGSPSVQFSVTVTVPTSADLPAITDALSAVTPAYATNNSVFVQYYPQSLVAVRQQILMAALADARAQADLLAADVGDTVGPVVSISTGTPNYYAPLPGPLNGPAVGGIQLTSSGTDLDTVSAQVTVTYQLQAPATA